MYCNQCGSDVPAAALACPACGTRLAVSDLPGPLSAAGAADATSALCTAGSPGPAGSPASHAGQQAPAFRFDPHRLTSGDRITGISTAVLLVSLFLPWFGVSFLGISAQADGLTGHGYLYLVLLLCLAILGYLALRAGTEELPARLPLTHERRLLAAAALNAALVLLAFLVKPDGTGWRYGAFTGLLAALAAVAPLVAPWARARQVRRARV
jgi:hypothetical protein